MLLVHRVHIIAHTTACLMHHLTALIILILERTLLHGRWPELDTVEKKRARILLLLLGKHCCRYICRVYHIILLAALDLTNVIS